MRRNLFSLAAAMTICFAPSSTYSLTPDPFEFAGAPLRTTRRRAASVNNGKLRRSKGKDQRRKLKSNRLHISRRVRRKHRRAGR